MLPDHLRDLVAAHMPIIALAEAGPSASDLADAPQLDHWMAMREFTGRIVLFGDVTGHPLLHDTGIVTSQLFGIDAKTGWARTLSRWYRLGRQLTLDNGAFPCPRGFLPVTDPDVVAAALAAHADEIRRPAAEARDQ
ncbi:ATP-dependent Lon protease [Sinirhodobacter populi]|uniref:ATP-dependent Lon protease n=1 Tax=Paenirhodobacter populi TaxID=2306993 RepID=A0A443KIL4_9RHOB|nr:DUF6634 family protein [Sinirhodobacter populi]RWR32603.1 ATP-dependent Lon protease [Sinirhodobacter populi]